MTQRPPVTPLSLPLRLTLPPAAADLPEAGSFAQPVEPLLLDQLHDLRLDLLPQLPAGHQDTRQCRLFGGDTAEMIMLRSRQWRRRIPAGRTSLIHACITAAHKYGVSLNNVWDAEAAAAASAAVLSFAISHLFFFTVTCLLCTQLRQKTTFLTSVLFFFLFSFSLNH